MKITLTNIEIANILAYVYSEESAVQNPTTKFSTTFAWNLRKAVTKLKALNDDFVQLQKEIIDHYSNDEYSYTNDNGERILKEEYTEEYNNKVRELYAQPNEIEINKVKISKVAVGGMDGLDNLGLSMADLDILSFIIDDEEG